MPSAKTMTIDTKTNHILLIAASWDPHPKIKRRERHPGGAAVR